MLKSKCAVLILTLCFLSTVLADSVLADSVENEAESKDCTAKVIACAGAVTGGAGAIIKECKALRQCKKECREEKRDCKREARGEKKSCKDECRDQFGTGKDYRNCADSCRDDKKEEKGECKETKTECKDVCRDTFRTPECKAARISAATVSIPACVAMVACIAASEKEAGQ
jgi:hypothetical protein